MTLTCTSCHNRSLETMIVRTEQTPNGVEVGICAICDRARCGKCRTTLPPTVKRCPGCDAVVAFS